MDIENLLNNSSLTEAQSISEIFEQDSRRFSRALTEEQEAKAE